MYSAMHVVAMGAKGEAMTGVFAAIILGLLIFGLVTYSQARRRAGSQDGRGGAGGPGSPE